MTLSSFEFVAVLAGVSIGAWMNVLSGCPWHVAAISADVTLLLVLIIDTVVDPQTWIRKKLRRRKQLPKAKVIR